MAINRDIYLDTRMMISRLESLFPASAQHPGLSSPAHAGLAALLQRLSTESAFAQAVRLIPSQSPMLRDEKFVKDREQFGGGKGRGVQISAQVRAEALVHMGQIFGILELLLADGRDWIAGTEHVSLADLEAVWPVDWVINDLRPPKEHFSAEKYQKVFAWQARFRALVKERMKANEKAVAVITGEQATPFVLGAGFSEEEKLTVDQSDPTGLKEGEEVEVFPTDGGGFFHQDRGKLVGLSGGEVVIVKDVQGTGKQIRVHAPRWQFRVRRVKGEKGKL
jgi:hypothetical protein